MLEMRVVCQEDIEAIKKLLRENNIYISDIEKYISNAMIAYENHTAVAAAGFVNVDYVAIITFVVVKKNRQQEYLGDGIIKATLNLADKKAIQKVFVCTDKHYIFFKKIGFKEVLFDELKPYIHTLNLHNITNNQKILAVYLPEFFFQSCKSKK